MPLTIASMGEKHRIIRIGGNDKARCFLEGIGFVPGEEVTLLSGNNGNVIVHVKDSRVAISSEMANKIMV